MTQKYKQEPISPFPFCEHLRVLRTDALPSFGRINPNFFSTFQRGNASVGEFIFNYRAMNGLYNEYLPGFNSRVKVRQSASKRVAFQFCPFFFLP